MRSVGLPDLLVAAVAEREHVTVLPYGAGYDLVARSRASPCDGSSPVGPSRSGEPGGGPARPAAQLHAP